MNTKFANFDLELFVVRQSIQMFLGEFPHSRKKKSRLAFMHHNTYLILIQ